MPYYYEQTPGYGASYTPGYGTSSYSLADMYADWAMPAYYNYGRSGLTPGYGSGLTPGYGSGLTPGYGSGLTPGYGRATTPGARRGRTPGYGSGRTPGYGTARTPGYNTVRTPGNYGSGRVHVFGPGLTPGYGYGTGTTPGAGLRTAAPRSRQQTQQALDRLALQRDSLRRQLRDQIKLDYPSYDVAEFNEDMKRREEDLIRRRELFEQDRQERPQRPRMNSQREPSYFRSFPGRAGSTPAVMREERTPGSGINLKLPTDAIKNPGKKLFGTPGKATPGPSKLRESTTFDNDKAAESKVEARLEAMNLEDYPTLDKWNRRWSQTARPNAPELDKLYLLHNPTGDKAADVTSFSDQRSMQWAIEHLRACPALNKADSDGAAEPIVEDKGKGKEVDVDNEPQSGVVEELSDESATFDNFCSP